MNDVTLVPRNGRFSIRVLFAVGLFVVIASSFAFSANASAKTEKLRLAYAPIPTNIAVVIAKEQGFYKKNGLDVKLTPIPLAARAVGALGKQFDIANGTPEHLLSSQAKGFGPQVVV